jgi:hypothetical protein
MDSLCIQHLISGGIITNYSCTSRCQHCLYACSPEREKDYIDEETLRANLHTIKSLGCNSVHIGGGEPFLDTAGLEMVVDTTVSMGVGMEYVETNSSWYRDPESSAHRLRILGDKGLPGILVSMSPFHNERIPFYKVKGVLEAGTETGLSVIPWIWDFFDEINSFDDKIPHRMEEYEAKFGKNYLGMLPSHYWIHLGGRALETFSRVYPRISYQEILESSHGVSCKELEDVSHFHLDLFGNYIPGLCSGLAVRRDDLGSPLEPYGYPIISLLYRDGVKGLFDFAGGEYNFVPKDDYISKCHLCFDIRRYLTEETDRSFPELSPEGFYTDLRSDLQEASQPFMEQ